MGSFWGEFLLGVLAFGLGIVLSITSEYFVFYGLIIYGFFQIIMSFVNLFKTKKRKDENGLPIKMVYPTEKPQEKEIFIKSIDSQKDLNIPKQVSISCTRKAMEGPVFLNGIQVGELKQNIPLTFTVSKKNNVVNISDLYEGIIFFHVNKTDGIGELKVVGGIQSAAIKIVKNTGLTEGIVEIQ
ncbi:MAG: hypothetical protein QM266_02330 [Bacillota bacterium]|mgnify:CR=1 FL=1|jgi:hypothetical protein|nr:hypothetical protein [Bacillota bacterium]NLP22292.1 hypothetical protein [Erysipelotrichaceae bacterium]